MPDNTSLNLYTSNCNAAHSEFLERRKQFLKFPNELITKWFAFCSKNVLKKHNFVILLDSVLSYDNVQ